MVTFDDKELHEILNDVAIEELYRDLEKYLDNDLYSAVLNLIVRQARDKERERRKEIDNG